MLSKACQCSREHFVEIFPLLSKAWYYRKHGDAFVSYYGEQDGKEKECRSPGASGHAQQEVDTGPTKGDRPEGSPGPMGYVYFIETEGKQYVKIGFSIRPLKRMAEIRSLNPQSLRLLGCIEGTLRTERDLHEKFSEDRTNGEWFYFTPEIQRFVDALTFCTLNDESPMLDDETSNEHQCMRCGYEWIRRAPWLPKQCPYCKQSNWDRPSIRAHSRGRKK